MDSFGLGQNESKPAKLPATVPEFYLGTVNTSDSSGAEITLDGQSEPMEKRYKCLKTGQALSADARVMIVKLSGTYVVLGEIAATAT